MTSFCYKSITKCLKKKDTMIVELFSFVTMYFALLTICVSVVSFALTGKFIGPDLLFSLLTVLSSLQVLAGIAVVISLYHNRVSAVKAYRCINTIRLHFGEDLKKNPWKEGPKDPAYFKADSLSFAVTTLVIFINSLCIAIFTYCLSKSIIATVASGITAFAIQLVLFWHRLWRRDDPKWLKLKRRKHILKIVRKKTEKPL